MKAFQSAGGGWNFFPCLQALLRAAAILWAVVVNSDRIKIHTEMSSMRNVILTRVFRPRSVL